MDAITDDITHGKVADAGELQMRVDGAVIGVAMEYSVFSADFGPK